MQREILWQREDGLGLEHLRLTSTADGFQADGMLLGLEDGKPLQAHYSITCDCGWRVREANVAMTGSAGEQTKHLGLRADGAGRWQSRANDQAEAWSAAEELDGCIELDLYPSPFTNTLPIRRLRLTPGTSAEIRVAFIRLPELTVRPVQQRYTCLATDASGGRYRYEGLESAYQTELPVDADGLVVAYPGWFRRVFPASR